MENYRSLDAHVFFVSGWVQTVFHRKTTCGHVIAKADVKPSWRVTDEPHHPWVALKRNRPVITAHCDCMAGLGETCSHIGALLFKMEAAVRFGYTRSTCTDESCLWNQCFTKDVQPAPISDIKFYKQAAKDRLTNKKFKTQPTPSTEEEQQTFLESLSSLEENLVGLSAFKEYAGPFVGLGPKLVKDKLPPSLRNMFNERNNMMSDEDFLQLSEKTIENFKITVDEVKKVEDITRSQSSSLAWHHQRSGRITASVAGEVLHTSTSNPSLSLLKKICIPNTSSPTVPSLNWGKQHEEDAYKLYQFLMEVEDSGELDIIPKGEIFLKDISHKHVNLNVAKAGFCISFSKPFLGASPDGHVFCACCGKGLLEIKCPYNMRQTTLMEALKDKTFCLDADTFSVKRNHKYFAQVQLQMYACDGQYTDFVVWSPNDCVISRIRRDDAFIDEMVESLEQFWKCVVLPELLTRKIENSNVNKSGNITGYIVQKDADKTFCLCKTTKDNADMVGCDRCDDWFHPACLKLKRLPKSKTWYCPKCRQQKKKQKL
ncbi:uncharacterized protein LOC117327441 [Pecten maximus]|uniref:uncharacterized protein LOC117327441 n=1 Tax=Pecten maximus TaxID=6579 RepID=UPI0014588414|nr:uncharacterized protein LOC117327441 [Pecten maximus]